LKIAVDVEVFGATLVTAKVLGVLLNAVVIAPLLVVPFIVREHARRPIGAPFWGAVGMFGFILSITLSIASIDTLFYVEWTFLAKQYFGWSLLYWLCMAAPIAGSIVTYYGFKARKGGTGQTAYENKLSYNYYRIR
jgi:hypothetical protein